MGALSTFDRRCYWLFLIVTVNVPGFTAFDPTGKSHDLGVFNPQSISHILLTLLVAFAAFVFFLTKRSHSVIPLVMGRLPLIIGLYLLFLVTSLPWATKDVALSIYRLSEWALALTLIIGLYASSPQRPDILTTQLLYRIAAIVVLIVGAVALVSPDLALGSIDADTGFIQYRFGGAVYPPNTVGMLAAIAMYYAILFRRGVRRIFEVALFGAALVFTYSRGSLIAFVFGIFLLGIWFGKPLVRLLYVTAGVVAAIVGLAFQDKLITLLSRGKSAGSITAASGRLMIWSAGWRMFLAHPFRGWGFVSGVKRHFPDFYSNTTFAPQHLHNDLLQALASGGILAGLILIVVCVSALVRAFRHARASSFQQFLLFALIQVLFHAVEGPVFSAEYLPVGACALLCLTSLALVDRYGLPRVTQKRPVVNKSKEAFSILSPGSAPGSQSPA